MDLNGKLLPAAALACALCVPAWAEETPMRQIAVTGEGTVEAVPDMALLSLGVTNQAETAGAAMAATSAAVGSVLDRLGALGLEAKDVQTRNISLTPVWNDPGIRGGTPEISGFQASNTISVRVRDLDKLGTIMDEVVSDGANTFNGLSFSLQDPKPETEEARRRAVSDATARAQVLAQAAGVTLGPVQTITEMGSGGGGPVMMEMAMARGAGVPVAAGEVSVTVSVSMTFAITGE